tara:strand:- start:1024 stop:2304 length:1281 start_codon:yes stop_codon:yes gene_type:complete
MEDYTMVAEDNLVMLSNGTTVNKERLKPSDTVLGWDGDKFVPSNITKIELSKPEFVYAVEVGNKTVTVAKENGFWLDGGVEIFADKLTPGVSMVYVKDGDSVKLEMVTDVTKLYNEETVYTICGTIYRNFVSNGILLHNFDMEDYVTSGVIGSGFEAYSPFFLNDTNKKLDPDDLWSTQRATFDALIKGQNELLNSCFPNAAKPEGWDEGDKSGLDLGTGRPCLRVGLRTSNDAQRLGLAYEAYVKAIAKLSYTMEVVKAPLATSEIVVELKSEGVQVPDLSYDYSKLWDVAPMNYTGGQESPNLYGLAFRGTFLKWDDAYKAATSKETQYIFGESDFNLDIATVKSKIDLALLEFRKTYIALLQLLGVWSNKSLERSYTGGDANVPGIVLESDTWPVYGSTDTDPFKPYPVPPAAGKAGPKKRAS